MRPLGSTPEVIDFFIFCADNEMAKGERNHCGSSGDDWIVFESADQAFAFFSSTCGAEFQYRQ